MTETPTDRTIHLEDYTPPDYRVETVDLHFDLGEEVTTVTATQRIVANHRGEDRPLVLYGADLDLVGIRLNGRELGPDDYRLLDESLIIDSPGETFTLEVVTRLHPAANTALEGLYVSGGNFCTQCEAEGFRKITYFPDRPDVMAVYTTTLVADRQRYPVLLANGNRVEQGEIGEDRHYARWHDPFPKPSYLFALVAGDLACVEDGFTTASGREVAIRFYVQHGNEQRCAHAIQSLKQAMRWDEQVYGREYDLDIYMVVAVDDFNMGAMENKGLNVFNTAYVLAEPDTATDTDFVNVASVIAHEYFHNWSGNRVTCRDWFQLSLKEGFTVFRDQQFTADTTDPVVKRIDDVRLLRNVQFREDAGPMAHPVRPASYQEINNFYTATVYNKGAEVVRMLHTLLGKNIFRRGTDLYFDRHDGQAVTTDDFVAAMETASGRDLGQFKRWYDQAGTPVVTVDRHYDAANRRYTLTLRQACPPTPGQAEKQAFHIPVKTALLDRAGRPMPLRLQGEVRAQGRERVLELVRDQQTFVFVDVPEPPVPSLLRGFSAPVRLEQDLADDELAFLMAHDNDDFNRWEAGQQLAVRVMLGLVGELQAGNAPALDEALATAFGKTLENTQLRPALVAETLTLPAEDYVAEFMPVVDPQAIHDARQFLRRALADRYREPLVDRYHALAESGEHSLDAEAMGRRRLRNLCLDYLLQGSDTRLHALAAAQYEQGGNMTDVIAALTGLVHAGSPNREAVLEDFHARWRNEPLVLNKWFAIQAGAPLPDTLDVVQSLTEHEDFTYHNPNRVRSVIATFGMRNSVRFHQADGAGYRFLADQVLRLDDINPQIAARLVSPLSQWRRYDEVRQAGMRAELQRILDTPGLSRDVFEIVSKSLRETD